MSFFFIAALVYFSMHLLVWARMGAQAGLGWGRWFVGLPLVLLLTATPFLAHLIPAHWPQPLVRMLWWLVFVWIGVIFYLFWLQLAGMILETLVNRLPAAWTRFFPRGRRQLRLVVGLTVLIVGYGLYAAIHWQVPHVTLRTPLVAEDTRVVLVSDTHLGVMTRQAWVNRLVAFINDLKPDLVVMAGDQLNDHPEWLAPKAAVMADIKARLGVFAVLGNHEFYVGGGQSQTFHQQANIRLLRNTTHIPPGSGIQLIGIDDPAWNRRDHQSVVRELERLETQRAPDHFQILITHRPWAWAEHVAPSGIHLMVAGHTHGGQLFPFNWFVRQQYPHLKGLFQQDGHHLYVTAGAGTWGPPLRVGARPEVVIIDLIREN
jgi:uncharacterized protein